MTTIQWIQQDVDYLNSMKAFKKQFEESGDSEGVNKASNVIRKTEESLDNDVKSMFTKSNFNKRISFKLSEFIIKRVQDSDFFKVQKSTGIPSYKLEDIVNRESNLTSRTADAIQELTRIAISYNTNNSQ